MLIQHADLGAALLMPPLFRAYNEFTGLAHTDHPGHHEIITQASLRAAAAFRRDHPALSLHADLNALLLSPFGKPDWLLAYGSRETLFSTAARRHWRAPDL